MANWCSTALGFYVKKTDEEAVGQLKTLQSVLIKRMKEEAGGPNEDRGWIGRLLLEHCGLEKNDLPSSRGFMADVEDALEERGDFLTLRADCEDAWAPHMDVWERLLRNEKFNRIGLVVIAEEPGMGVFVTTDKDGIMFTDRYQLDYWLKKPANGQYEGDVEYFETEDQLLEAIKDITGVCVSSIGEIGKFESEFADKLSDDEYFLIRKFEVYEPIYPAVEEVAAA